MSEMKWSDYAHITDMQQRLTVIESILTCDIPLIESNDTNYESYFKDLHSDDPICGNKYIGIILSLVNNKIIEMDRPEVLEIVAITDDEFRVINSEGREVQYPSPYYGERMISKSFFFNSATSYDMFRTAMSLKFGTALPQMELNEAISESMITEANQGSVILIDFQPAYDSDQFGYIDAIEKAMHYINEKRPNVTAFFNGEDVGIEDTPNEVAYHFMKYGLDEELVNGIKFKEKSYAWLRQWMDEGVDDAMTIRVIRYLVMNDLNDSREIEDEPWLKLVGEDFNYYDDREMNIYIPDINIGSLKQLSGSLIGGGGKDECLKEIQLLLNAFNIKYKMVNDWIYG